MALDYEYEMRIQVKRESAEQAQILAPKMAAELAPKMAAEMAAEMAKKMVAEQAEKIATEIAAEERQNLIANNLQKGFSAEMIASFMSMPISEVQAIQKKLAL